MPLDTPKAKFQRAIELATKIALDAMREYGNIDTKGPNFTETPDRVARAYVEIFEGIFDNGDRVKEILDKSFPSTSQEMVTVGPITVWSICPHHLLPCKMQVWVGYIPKDRVLGLSKMARLAEIIAKKPALQEDTTVAIARALQDGLQPKGAACVIKGRHLCMEMRGIKKEATTTTTALEGVFFEPAARAEFLAAVRGDK